MRLHSRFDNCTFWSTQFLHTADPVQTSGPVLPGAPPAKPVSPEKIDEFLVRHRAEPLPLDGVRVAVAGSPSTLEYNSCSRSPLARICEESWAITAVRQNVSRPRTSRHDPAIQASLEREHHRFFIRRSCGLPRSGGELVATSSALTIGAYPPRMITEVRKALASVHHIVAVGFFGTDAIQDTALCRRQPTGYNVTAIRNNAWTGP